MKRIICCSDGTWNKPDEKDKGVISPTNVSIFYQSIDEKDENGNVQCIFYDQGVGTQWYNKLSGGLLGAGINQNIIDAYQFIVTHFASGDEIFLLGFSRGAYTARSVAGLIFNAGILKPEHSDKIQQAFDLYRRRDDLSHPEELEAIEFKKAYCHLDVKIKFIGIWDTVGALGIPGKLFDIIKKELIDCQFHDVKLSHMVENAYHAVAIDEQRVPFEATLWNQTPSCIRAGQIMEQQWFPGVHADVGGGYCEHGLSDVALLWIFEKAKALGLKTKDDIKIEPDALGNIHQSMSFWYRTMGKVNRKIGNGPTFNEQISDSALTRWNNDIQQYQKKSNPYLKLILKNSN